MLLARAFLYRLVVFRFDGEEALRMAAYRTFFRCFYGFYGVAAVSAHPKFLFAFLEDLAVFDISQKQFIACFMLFFDLADFGEQESDLREAFFFCGSSEFRIHGSPFTVFTGSGHFQVFCSGLFDLNRWKR